jgi:transposase-like protein
MASSTPDDDPVGMRAASGGGEHLTLFEVGDDGPNAAGAAPAGFQALAPSAWPDLIGGMLAAPPPGKRRAKGVPQHDAARRAFAQPSSRRRVSTRGYGPLMADVGIDTGGMSRSNLSRDFVKKSKPVLDALRGRSLEPEKFVIGTMDGMKIAGRTTLVIVAVTMDGRRIPLGLGTDQEETKEMVTAALDGLVTRQRADLSDLLWVIDGGDSLRRGIWEVLGKDAQIATCRRHKADNIREKMSDKLAFDGIKGSLKDIVEANTPQLAVRRANALTKELETRGYRPAAELLREHAGELVAARRTRKGRAERQADLERDQTTNDPLTRINGAMRDLVPQRLWEGVRLRLDMAWGARTYDEGLASLKRIVFELADEGHIAADSKVWDGLEETLTITRLGVRHRDVLDATETNNLIEGTIGQLRRELPGTWYRTDLDRERWAAYLLVGAASSWSQVAPPEALADLSLAVVRAAHPEVDIAASVRSWGVAVSKFGVGGESIPHTEADAAMAHLLRWADRNEMPVMLTPGALGANDGSASLEPWYTNWGFARELRHGVAEVMIRQPGPIEFTTVRAADRGRAATETPADVVATRSADDHNPAEEHSLTRVSTEDVAHTPGRGEREGSGERDGSDPIEGAVKDRTGDAAQAAAGSAPTRGRGVETSLRQPSHPAAVTARRSRGASRAVRSTSHLTEQVAATVRPVRDTPDPDTPRSPAVSEVSAPDRTRARSRYTPEYRDAVVTRFRESGVSARAFADANGLPRSTFTDWLREAGPPGVAAERSAPPRSELDGAERADDGTAVSEQRRSAATVEGAAAEEVGVGGAAGNAPRVTEREESGDRLGTGGQPAARQGEVSVRRTDRGRESRDPFDGVRPMLSARGAAAVEARIAELETDATLKARVADLDRGWVDGQLKRIGQSLKGFDLAAGRAVATINAQREHIGNRIVAAVDRLEALEAELKAQTDEAERTRLEADLERTHTQAEADNERLAGLRRDEAKLVDDHRHSDNWLANRANREHLARWVVLRRARNEIDARLAVGQARGGAAAVPTQRSVDRNETQGGGRSEIEALLAGHSRCLGDERVKVLRDAAAERVQTFMDHQSDNDVLTICRTHRNVWRNLDRAGGYATVGIERARADAGKQFAEAEAAGNEAGMAAAAKRREILDTREANIPAKRRPERFMAEHGPDAVEFLAAYHVAVSRGLPVRRALQAGRSAAPPSRSRPREPMRAPGVEAAAGAGYGM